MQLQKCSIAQRRDFCGHIICSFTCLAGSLWYALGDSTQRRNFTSFLRVSSRAGYNSSLYQPINHVTNWQSHIQGGAVFTSVRQLCNKGAVSINYGSTQAEDSSSEWSSFYLPVVQVRVSDPFLCSFCFPVTLQQKLSSPWGIVPASYQTKENKVPRNSNASRANICVIMTRIPFFSWLKIR